MKSHVLMRLIICKTFSFEMVSETRVKLVYLQVIQHHQLQFIGKSIETPLEIIECSAQSKVHENLDKWVWCESPGQSPNLNPTENLWFEDCELAVLVQH